MPTRMDPGNSLPAGSAFALRDPNGACRIAFSRRPFNLGENGISISVKNGLQLFDFLLSDGDHFEICYSRQRELYIHRWVSSLEAAVTENRHGQKVTVAVRMEVWLIQFFCQMGTPLSSVHLPVLHQNHLAYTQEMHFTIAPLCLST
ncbi:hypothetical protein GQ457_17G015070 [Hibiscus cannabinus]